MDLCSRSVEFRANASAGDGDGRTLEGYAAVFDQDTEINSWEGRFTERIAKGAFKKTLRERKPIMQYDHGRDSRVGSVPIGVYEDIREDDHGLFVSGKVFDNPVVEPIRQAIEGGAVTGMSFKFRVTRDEWRDKTGKRIRGDEISKLLWEPGDRGPLARTIREVSLYEAGPVSTPAYAGTSVGVRMGEITEADREALAAEYRRTMAEAEAEEHEHDVRAWLDAESEHRDAVTAWLDAESEYRDSVDAWLAAESEYRTSTETDAARQGTSAPVENTQEDAARRGTSDREETETPSTTRKIPMTLEELRARLAAIDVRLSDLGTEYRDAELPEAEQKEWDDLDAERAKVEGSITKIEARMARIAKLADEGSSERGSDRGAPAFHKKRDIYDLEGLRKDSFSADDFVERARDNARTALSDAKFPMGAAKGDTVREGLEALLDNADSSSGELAKRILTTGSATYERAFGKVAMAGNTNPLTGEEARALALGTDAAGGFAVPYQLDPTLIQLGSGYISPIRQLARKVKLIGKEWQTLTITEATVYRAAEGATAIDGSPTLAQRSVKVNKVHGFIPFSIELEQDWPQLRSEMTDLLNKAKAKEEANSFLLGTGVAPQPEGLITGANVTVAAGSGLGITAADIYKLEEALPVEFRDNAAFLGNKSTYNKIRQLANNNDGAQLWVRLGDKTPNQLIGYPAYESSLMAGPGTNGNKMLVFGDFENFVILDRIGMSIELIPMLFDPANGNRPTGQRGFYATWRNNSKVVNPNAFRVLTATT
ncbi:phage major capsid protein [Rhodococcus hoagii]|nr:phage major capsid protein [Prescottella equi]MBM4613733.1 phage major capsid protein [Prescottella equi]MBM4618003.1 phage major capsid protein [Prescottella equi]